MYSYKCISLNYHDRISTRIIVNMSSIYTLLIVSIYISKIKTNLRNTFYEDKEIQDIMKKYYQIKRNLIIDTELNFFRVH